MTWGAFVAAFLWAQAHQPGAMERCTLRVDAKGIYVDGDPMTRDQAVVKCKQTSGASVMVADDAAPNVWSELRGQLERAHVKIYMRGIIDDRVCMDNPLAKGCP
jgi:hypothetical protein